MAKFVEFYLDNAGEVAPQVGYVAVTDEIAEAEPARRSTPPCKARPSNRRNELTIAVGRLTMSIASPRSPRSHRLPAARPAALDRSASCTPCCGCAPRRQRAHDRRHRADSAVRVAAVLPQGVGRRVPHRHDLDAARRRPAQFGILPLFCGTFLVAGGSAIIAIPAGLGRGDLPERVRLAAGARRRQAAAWKSWPAFRRSCSATWRSCSSRRWSASVFPERRHLQRAQREHRRGDHDPADDRVAERGRAAVGAAVAARGGLRPGRHEARRDRRRRRARRRCRASWRRSCWRSPGPSARRWP